MSFPSFLFAFLLASLYGVAFFLIAGRSWLGMVMYWLVALLGFALGEIISRLFAINLMPIGAVHAIEASVTSLILLWLTWRLWPRK